MVLILTLTQWYEEMLEKARERGIVSRVSNIVDAYMDPNENNLATVIPYFEALARHLAAHLRFSPT